MEDEMGSEDKERSLYLIQIQHLDKQLERFQLKCDELEKQNKRLPFQYVELQKDKADVSEYLKHLKADKEKNLEELAKRLEGQQEDIRRDNDALKLKHRLQIQELKDRVDEIEKENETRAVRLEEQQEEVVLMRQQLCLKEFLEEQLVSQREENEAAIRSLKDEELERTELSDQIKEAINSRIEAEISVMTQEERAQHDELLDEVQTMLLQNNELWTKNDGVESDGLLISFQITQLKRKIKRLTKEKLAHEEGARRLRWESQQLKEQLEICGIELQHLQAQREDLSRQLAAASEQHRLNSAGLVQLEAELQQEASWRRRLEASVQEAVVLLRHILTDSRASRTQWERLMDVLENAAPPEDTTESSRPGRRAQTAEPGADRADALTLTSDLTFLMARYRPGDLGLVPRPSWTHKAVRTDARPANADQPISSSTTAPK